MNNPLNKISAFARQASVETRRAVADGRVIAKSMAKAGGRQMAIRAGVGMVAGGAAGYGISRATGDGSAVRDGALGAVLGAGAGASSWAMGSAGRAIWKDQRLASKEAQILSKMESAAGAAAPKFTPPNFAPAATPVSESKGLRESDLPRRPWYQPRDYSKPWFAAR